MKTIKEFIVEGTSFKRDKNELISRFKEVDKLNPKNEDDMDKLNVLAMDALDSYWNNEKWDKKINDEFYSNYKEAFSLMLNNKNEEAKEKFIFVISSILKTE